jgi:hypothetical protein
MTGEKNLKELLKSMKPVLNEGDYVFCTLGDMAPIDINEVVLMFREQEGITVIVERETAERLNYDYSMVASWITLTVHSSLEAVGLTAAFSKALADENISCNVVAAYFHDHLFVPKKDVEKAMNVLSRFSSW